DIELVVAARLCCRRDAIIFVLERGLGIVFGAAVGALAWWRLGAFGLGFTLSLCRQHHVDQPLRGQWRIRPNLGERLVELAVAALAWRQNAISAFASHVETGA